MILQIIMAEASGTDLDFITGIRSNVTQAKSQENWSKRFLTTMPISGSAQLMLNSVVWAI